MDKKKCTAIILAAGQGKRMGTKVQKQFLNLGGKPVLWYALYAFENSPVINDIILVTGADLVEWRADFFEGLLNKQACDQVLEELAQILDRVELKSHMGVCLDTCHVYDAGYDLAGELDQVLEEFDQVIGLERLKAIHMNDSKNPFASHKDRHEKIGEGSLGLETFEGMVNHPKLKGIPIYLETPNELEGYAREILLLRNMEK